MISSTLVPPSINLESVRLEIRALQPELVKWRRQIHQYPELGFEEHLTSALVSKLLTQWKIDHQTAIAGTGIVATITGQTPGPVLAIRADMDALPIDELNQVPYRSHHQGKMHACGHDGHTAIALGTARYLAQHRQNFSGTIKIIFQPAEEGPGGAKPMIEAGVLKNPDVDALIGLHLWNSLPMGKVAVRSGPFMAAVESFKLLIMGKGGHGAMPDQTIDSVIVSAQIVNGLQTIVSRNINPLQSAVVTVGELHAGTRHNVIADTAKLSGTVRYYDPQLQGYLQERIDQTIAGICKIHGATYDLNYWRQYPAVINDRRIANFVYSVAQEVVETSDRLLPDYQTLAAEDVSFFLQAVPGCYFFLGSANPDRDLAYPHHHPRFNFDEIVLQMGVELFVRCAEQFAPRYPL
ncbi:M20 family metallopeptidase [Roseofilum sp. BLCC_M91]|uniref:M20 family metallopeptidase n=1 Tax=Roseofilum halophilum BLCC-M91 TaxID=3022259 RepID=A0ABT7BIE7_9CYAN|nr:M20 family metallopeptidase [Roseofilum halophilum]MDJ1178964.1 M20 family metallopeptidase [Roseofilum halophilum BLCC-M91]